LAFQLQDDYLDTYGNPARFGKQIGGDILNDKKTWLLISAIEQDKTGEALNLIGAEIQPDEKIRKMKAVYNRLDLPAKCRCLIDQYANEAIGIVTGIEMPDASKALFIDMARQSATRDH